MPVITFLTTYQQLSCKGIDSRNAFPLLETRSGTTEKLHQFVDCQRKNMKFTSVIQTGSGSERRFRDVLFPINREPSSGSPDSNQLRSVPFSCFLRRRGREKPSWTQLHLEYSVHLRKCKWILRKKALFFTAGNCKMRNVCYFTSKARNGYGCSAEFFRRSYTAFLLTTTNRS